MMQRSSRPVEQTGGPFLFKTRPPLVANPPAHIEPPADRRKRLLALLNRHHKAHSLVHGTGLLPPHRQGPPCGPVDLLPMSTVYSVTHVAGQDLPHTRPEGGRAYRERRGWGGVKPQRWSQHQSDVQPRRGCEPTRRRTSEHCGALSKTFRWRDHIFGDKRRSVLT